MKNTFYSKRESIVTFISLIVLSRNYKHLKRCFSSCFQNSISPVNFDLFFPWTYTTVVCCPWTGTAWPCTGCCIIIACPCGCYPTFHRHTFNRRICHHRKFRNHKFRHLKFRHRISNHVIPVISSSDRWAMMRHRHPLKSSTIHPGCNPIAIAPPSIGRYIIDMHCWTVFRSNVLVNVSQHCMIL